MILILSSNLPEYLIIDGASKDNTVSIAEAYRQQFESKGVSYIVNSEPDKGIYDAMNKGIQLATGDVIGILNSDDCYATTDILSTVAKGFEENEIETLYGNLLYVAVAIFCKLQNHVKEEEFINFIQILFDVNRIKSCKIYKNRDKDESYIEIIK